MLNYNLWSPVLRPFSLDEDLEPWTLRAIDIFADGDLHFEDERGSEVTLTFTGVAPCYRYVCQIKKVFSSGTTIDIGDLVGLR